MKRGIILILIIISLMYSVTAFDSETYQACGGDNELTIDCVGDEELFFIGAEAQPEAPTPPSGGGDGTKPLNINITPTEFNINLALGDKIEKTVTVTNFGFSPLNISINQQNLEGMAIPRENYLYLNPGETKTFNIAFIDKNETGIFPGKIIIGDKEILVSLNIRTKLLLFDSNIIILNKDYKVPSGQKLKTQVTLIPLGDKERLDVTLNYVIKDYNGKIFLEESETVLIEEQMELQKNFNTGMLPLGEYVIGVELVYPNGIAISSARFEIVEKKLFSDLLSLSPEESIFYSLVIIITITILIVISLIIRKIKINSQTTNNL